ncbi:SMG8 [Mytilus edulis]|uniref:SMG8 n=1 Tax=Mytilus edulis TaxID=6550 RepID=A0A8S3UC46_MYTED|nr:SMG8 [Mytilus edulis]
MQGWAISCWSLELFGSGSLTGVFEGKHYNRALRLLKIVFEAFKRLRWEAFGSWLNSNDENEFLDPNFQASVLSIVAQIRRNLTADNLKTLLMSPYVSKLFEAFSAYCNVSEGPMKKFWNSYIEMVELLLVFIRATREGNWELHLACVEKMLPCLRQEPLVTVAENKLTKDDPFDHKAANYDFYAGLEESCCGKLEHVDLPSVKPSTLRLELHK